MLKVKVFSVGVMLIVFMVILLAFAGCAKPTEAPPDTRCFTEPFLSCSQLADRDGE
jgi:hypothetical protein